MDVNRALRTAAQTGTVLLGAKETLRAVKDKKAKLVIVAGNVRGADEESIAAAAKTANVPIYKFKGTNQELGPACGKPFAVGVLSILDAGESDVLALARQ